MDQRGGGWYVGGINCLTERREGEMATMKGPHRLPDFSVVIWIKKNENFSTLRSEVLAAAGVEPYEMTEYQGMADFHFAMASMIDARKLAEALGVVSQRPEVVLLRIISLVDDVESISIKDERVTKH
jgi:acetolactate synthase regulatory subunit